MITVHLQERVRPSTVDVKAKWARRVEISHHRGDAWWEFEVDAEDARALAGALIQQADRADRETDRAARA